MSQQRIDEIRRRINTALTPTHLDIEDQSHLHVGHAGAAGGGGHFAITIRADALAGLPTLKKHRMIYDAVGDMMQSDIHALSITVMD